MLFRLLQVIFSLSLFVFYIIRGKPPRERGVNAEGFYQLLYSITI